MIRDGTITAISAQTDDTDTWVLEIRKNDNTAVIASITMTAQEGNHNRTINVDLNEGDFLQAYCNGTSGKFSSDTDRNRLEKIMFGNIPQPLKPMFKKGSLLFLLVCSLSSNGQEAFQNFGNLKIHSEASVGFHHDLINNGFMDDNLGLVGFFSNQDLSISGALRPIFYDMEVMVADDLVMEVGVGVTNNMNFILGDVTTPRMFSDVNLDFIDQAFYNGQSDITKVDGYAALTNKMNFTFPVGYGNELKPLQILSDEINITAKCAYFRENPNNPNSFPIALPTENREANITTVSPFEFWDLDATTSSRVSLFWNAGSALKSFVGATENLRVVGWHSEKKAWLNLGFTAVSGDLESGTITSDTFDPQEYEAITFGSLSNFATANLGNYLLTPNGDGINDVLVLDAISLSPENNTLRIYNRWGRLVYTAEGYQNDFNGVANTDFVITKNSKLPDGVYFYLLELWDIDLSHQGYLAIDN